MSQSGSIDRMQAVGYIFEDKKLIVTLSDEMAQRMKFDGWDVRTEKEVGSFITITSKEVVK